MVSALNGDGRRSSADHSIFRPEATGQRREREAKIRETWKRVSVATPSFLAAVNDDDYEAGHIASVKRSTGISLGDIRNACNTRETYIPSRGRDATSYTDFRPRPIAASRTDGWTDGEGERERERAFRLCAWKEMR